MLGKQLRIGSLFSGIGGLELGLEWAGVGHTVWQVEQDSYCRAVLALHWPDALRFNDVRDCNSTNLPPVDVLCGGFPCQDLSHAGRRAGIAVGTRSGMWYEFQRIIGELAPAWVIVENVEALETDRASRNAVLGGLRSLGYRGERSVVSACSLGASHMRQRLFIVAHAASVGQSRSGRAFDAGDSAPHTVRQADHAVPAFRRTGESGPPRVAYGIPHRAHRLTALGNAVVPQVAEIVGQRLLEIAFSSAGGMGTR